MTALRASMFCLLTACTTLACSTKAYSGIGTTLPVSAELATNIAAGLFPVAIKMNKGKLFLTDPIVIFLDNKEIGIQVRFQAYDHRPQEGVALSELGIALIAGKLDYDSGTRQILLHQPRIDKLDFDRDSEATQHFITELKATWSAQVTNPIRTEIPPHPYLLPFKENIRNISYDGKNINLDIRYGYQPVTTGKVTAPAQDLQPSPIP